MSAMKEYSLNDKMDEMEFEAKEDKMYEHMHCTKCGENPKIWPAWTGSENWYAGKCDTCNKHEEFYLDIEDRSEV